MTSPTHLTLLIKKKISSSENGDIFGKVDEYLRTLPSLSLANFAPVLYCL